MEGTVPNAVDAPTKSIDTFKVELIVFSFVLIKSELRFNK